MKFSKAQTITEYQQFISDYPNHTLVSKANQAIDDLTWLNKTVSWSEKFSYSVSTGVGLFDAFSGGGIKESFVVTFQGVVKSNLEDKIEVIIQKAQVTDGRYSYAGAQQYHAASRKATKDSIGKTRILDKTGVSFVTE